MLTAPRRRPVSPYVSLVAGCRPEVKIVLRACWHPRVKRRANLALDRFLIPADIGTGLSNKSESPQNPVHSRAGEL